MLRTWRLAQEINSGSMYAARRRARCWQPRQPGSGAEGADTNDRSGYAPLSRNPHPRVRKAQFI